MKKIFLVGLLSTMFSTSIMADEYIVDLMKLDGNNVDSAYDFEIKYKADLGGYTYLQIVNEDSTIDQFSNNARKVSFGLGVEEKWEREKLSADVFIDIGYFASTFDSTNTLTNNKTKEKYSGVQYRGGIKFHPFTEDLDVIVEIRNDSSASISGKDTKIWGGLAYRFDDYRFIVMTSDDDLIKAGISFKF
jgi:hypothetical protein